jgi:methionyl-tRNA formyltransferase
LRDPGVFEKLQEWNSDAIIVAAFGQILRENVLQLPAFGCINVHASLLPRWRGAAPIQAAILSGDEVSGITIMQMDAGIDTGRIFSQKELTIKENETAIELGNRLAKLGAELLGETLPRIFSGQQSTFPQDDSLATYAPKIEKSMGELDFSLSSAQLLRNIRAFHPWPGTQLNLDGQVIKVIKAWAVIPGNLFPGKRGLHEGLPAIGTGDGDLVIEELQPAGKKPMTGKAFLQGFKNWEMR